MAADFARRRQFTSDTPYLEVAPGLSAGLHTFELVVEDDSGNRSRPARVTVNIIKLRPITLLRGRYLRALFTTRSPRVR